MGVQKDTVNSLSKLTPREKIVIYLTAFIRFKVSCYCHACSTDSSRPGFYVRLQTHIQSTLELLLYFNTYRHKPLDDDGGIEADRDDIHAGYSGQIKSVINRLRYRIEVLI